MGDSDDVDEAEETRKEHWTKTEEFLPVVIRIATVISFKSPALLHG